MFWQVVAVFVIALAIQRLLSRRRTLKLPSGPPGVPIFGNLFQLSKNPHETYSKWMEEFGKIFYVKFFKSDVIVMSDIKLIKECFNENVFTGRSGTIFTSVLSQGKNGVIHSDGQTWVEQRRFTLRHLRDFGFGKQYMESQIMDEVQDIIDNLKKQEGQSVTIEFSLAVLNSLWLIVAGKKFKQDDEEKLEILHDIDRTFATLSLTSIIHLMMPSLLDIFPGPLGYTKCLNIVDRLQKMLTEEVREHEKSLPEDGNPRDFIDAYLQEIKATQDANSTFYKEEGYKQLGAVIGDLFFAGSDTTSSTLSWSTLYLASHPEIQTKLQNEMDAIAGKTRSISLADRPNLPYAEATISEILRKSSLVVTGVFHTATQDTTFQGYDIPKGTWLMANQYAIHHDKAIWGDPGNFRPERFLSEDGKTVLKNESLLPFSVGKRVCIGESLARDEIFLFMTNLFHRFTIRLDESKPKPSLDAQPGFLRRPQVHHVILKDRFV